MAFGATHKRSRQVADASAKGVHYLMKKNKITEIDGLGHPHRPDRDRGRQATAARRRHTFDNLIIATGAKVRMLPGMSVSEQRRDLRGADPRRAPPGSIIIGGSGAIGVEFAYVMTNFGVDVTIVEFLDRMVPTEDADVSKELLKQYKKLGVKVLLSTKVESGRGHRQRRQGHGQPSRRRRRAGARGRQDARGVRLRARGSRATASRRPASSSPTAARSRSTPAAAPTSTDVYAIGDVTGKLMLAHTAEAMGVVAAETIAGAETMEINFDMIPRATFCQPQIALLRLLRGSRPRRRGTTSRSRRSRSRPTARRAAWPRASAS